MFVSISHCDGPRSVKRVSTVFLSVCFDLTCCSIPIIYKLINYLLLNNDVDKIPKE